uniref:hypothetical protein n=1 Tax=uncultured Tenacibaculum sp. TaxID=174713 RepID=UPI00262D3915|nr:hypothetical protein [uncultured Tenacibaculum sp.]
MSHIFAHNSGMQLIDNIGFDNTWNFMIVISGIGVLFLFMLMRIIKKEMKSSLEVKINPSINLEKSA